MAVTDPLLDRSLRTSLKLPKNSSFRGCLRDQFCCYGAGKNGYSTPFPDGNGYVPHLIPGYHMTLGYYPRTQQSPPPLTEVVPFTIDSLA